MSPKRLFSSDEIIAALQRGGFELARRSKGSHQSLTRLRPDGQHDVVVVPLGKREIPKGTLDAILAQAGITYQIFLVWAKVKTKG